jgi:hypothetical protein
VGFPKGCLNILIRLENERIIRDCNISEIEIEEIKNLISLGIVAKEKRKDPDEPTEDEFYYSLTEEGKYSDKVSFN